MKRQKNIHSDFEVVKIKKEIKSYNEIIKGLRNRIKSLKAIKLTSFDSLDSKQKKKSSDHLTDSDFILKFD